MELESVKRTRIPTLRWWKEKFLIFAIPWSQGYVAFDRFFTSIANLDELDKRKINAVGTILKTRVGQPVMESMNRTFHRTNLSKFGGEPGTGRQGLFIW
jgi:hypothetical protein